MKSSLDLHRQSPASSTRLPGTRICIGMRNITLIVAVTCTLMLGLGGCSPASDTAVKEQSRTEPLRFSVLYNNNALSPFKEDWLVIEEYKKRKNVEMDVHLGIDSDYANSIAQAMESEAPPDVILKVWPDNIKPYVAAGLLLAVGDYLENLPYFQAYIAEHDLQDEIDLLRDSSGTFHLLPGYRRQVQVQQWIYRSDLFDRVPATLDELYDMLVAIKESHPNCIPITADYGTAHLLSMLGADYGIMAGWSGTAWLDREESSPTWKYSPATENYRQMLIFLNRCFAAGLIDPDLFTQTSADYYRKVQDGRAVVTVTWISSGFAPWNKALAELGIENGRWEPMPVPESTIGLRTLPQVDPFRKGIALSAALETDPRRDGILSFLDWAVYSEEGRILTDWGVQGVTFEQSETGKRLLSHIKSVWNPEGTVESKGTYGTTSFFDLAENEEFEDYKKPPEIVQFLATSLERNETLPVQPPLHLDASATAMASLINEQLTAYMETATKAFITGDMDPIDDWDRYLVELEARGASTLTRIWNDAWKQK